MNLYAISDLHLDLNGEKPMDIFGEQWVHHDEKIKKNWLEKVKDEDTVIIGGDISWSMRMNQGEVDLQWIHQLPGKKIIVKGNHDYWWGSITKLNSMYEDMKFIQNNYFTYSDYAICGTRGWLCPYGDNYSVNDQKIYDREIIRIKLSLEEAVKAGYEKIIVVMHYPPVNDKFEPSEFTKIFEQYPVEKVIYGHIHGPSLKRVYIGKHNDVEYILTSCDFINFSPIVIL